MSSLDWAYGVTTVPERRLTTLPKTLDSLSCSGFDNPRLFVDGEHYGKDYHVLAAMVTCHHPRIRAAGNWWLALWELYIRNPHADRYALFQDDIICVKNLRTYLERGPFPGEPGGHTHPGYLNLYLSPDNSPFVPKLASDQSVPVPGWFPSNQMGKGALGLVFDQRSVVALLSHSHFTRKFKDTGYRAWSSIDGGVIQAIMECEMAEYVHYPSLLQHCGREPTICTAENDPQNYDKWRFVTSPHFFGPDFDPLTIPVTAPRTQRAFPRPASPPTPQQATPCEQLRRQASPINVTNPAVKTHVPPADDFLNKPIPEVRFGTLVCRAVELVGKDLNDLIAWVRKSTSAGMFSQRLAWAEKWAVWVLTYPHLAMKLLPEYEGTTGIRESHKDAAKQEQEKGDGQ